jgi:hypothetical protein
VSHLDFTFSGPEMCIFELKQGILFFILIHGVSRAMMMITSLFDLIFFFKSPLTWLT